VNWRDPGLAQATEAPWTFAAPWGARGHLWHPDRTARGTAAAAGAAGALGVDGAAATGAAGAAVHWIEFGSSRAGPPAVFVHGLGGSHLNWTLTGPALATGRRALALDLYGFGLTPGNRGTATVSSNAVLLDRFLREVAGTPAILVGNSMGGLLSILQAYTHPTTVAGLVLIAPALPPARQRPDWTVSRRFLLYAMPGLGEFCLRLAQARVPPRVAVQRVIDLCFADPSRATPALLEASTALAEYRRSVPGCDESLLAAARSLMRLLAQRARYEAMMAAIDVPVLLIGGDQDRLVPVASVRRAAALNPGWESHILTGVGHTAQLETPDLVIGAVRDWLGRHGTLTAH
jgi:pimeloyl-ACP methyl ester carboxylesterase